MHIKVLGCSGGAVAGAQTTSFLLDDTTLIDAGTGVLDLSLEAQYSIQQIFITHTHFDHIVGLPFLIENVVHYRQHNNLPPIQLYASQAALEDIKKHVLNGRMWPNFTRLPSSQNPVIECVPLEVGARIALDKDTAIEAISAVHSVPTQGYAVHYQNNTWIYTGDTAHNPALWEYINHLPQQGKRLRWLLTETTFVNDDQVLADLSGHCTVNNVAKDIREHLVHGEFELHVMHLKPHAREQVLQELEALRVVASAKNCTLHVVQQGQVFTTETAQTAVDATVLHAA